MKFKYSGIIDVSPLKDYPNWLVVTRGHGRYKKGERLHIKYLAENDFKPADCEALNLVDPDRTKRLCPPII